MSASAKACPAPAGVTAPTQEEIRLAKEPGTSTAQVAAREKVVRAFYHGRPGLGDLRVEDDLDGIDLTQPVELVHVPPPESMQQWVRDGGNLGNWFDPEGGQIADALGLNSAGRNPEVFQTPAGTGLICTAAPIVDDWTDPKNPVDCKGGGRQLVVDDNMKNSFTRAGSA